MTSRGAGSSSRRRRWTVDLAGRRQVVDLSWPGFSNWIAVDGVVIEAWSWPGNNLYTTRRFFIDGTPALVVRRRAGLASFDFSLVVDNSTALVQEVPGGPGGFPGAPAGPQAVPRGGIVAAVILIVGVVVAMLALSVVVAQLSASASPLAEQVIGLIVAIAIVGTPVLLLVAAVAIAIHVARAARR